MEPFSFFSITGRGTDLDYCDSEFFDLNCFTLDGRPLRDFRH